MLSRRSLLTGAALAPFANLAFAADPYVAGRQYQPILPPVRTSLDKIEVRVFFARTAFASSRTSPYGARRCPPTSRWCSTPWPGVRT